MPNVDPSCSARTVLTNPNSFSPVPSVAATDGCCERWGVVPGNSQNGSTRLRGQHRRSQPSSGWILLGPSAGICRSPGWPAAAPAPRAAWGQARGVWSSSLISSLILAFAKARAKVGREQHRSDSETLSANVPALHFYCFCKSQADAGGA